MRVLFFLLALFAASPLWALSCLQPDPIREYLERDSEPDAWGVVVGRIHFDEARLPGRGDRGAVAAGETDLHAQLVGRSLGPDGFQKPFQANVTLRVVCLGPWCGSAESGKRYLIYLRKDGRQHTAFAGPCGGGLYPDPTVKTLSKVQRCFAGGACRASVPRR